MRGQNGQTLLVKVNAPLKFRDATCTFFIQNPNMNSLNNLGDTHSGGEVNSVESVSRSGRVRKKNSLLALYESPDVIEKRGRKSEKNHKGKHNDGNDNDIRSHEKSHLFKEKKQHSYDISSSYNQLHNYSDVDSPSNIYHSTGSYGLTFDGDVPDIAAEEIIDEGMLDEDDEATELADSLHAANIRLKSQAESTYMMEKSFEKSRKVTGPHPGTKAKAPRKDKGSPRVTAYMLWAKEQRANFAKKFPHLDFSSLSKKLSDLWATVPQNQKKMWKTKAAKIMRKNANGAENMKNSGGSNFYLAKKSTPSLPQRKGMKNTTPEEVYLPKRPPGRPKKLQLLPSAEPRLTSVTPGPSPKSTIYNHITTNSSQAKTKTRIPTMSSSSSTISSSKANIETQKEPYQFQVTGTNPLDAAANLSLLGESMKKMGEQLMRRQDQSVNESLSVLMDSLLCSVGPLLCLTQNVPELNCIPEEQLKRILDNAGYVMPGL